MNKATNLELFMKMTFTPYCFYETLVSFGKLFVDDGQARSFAIFYRIGYSISQEVVTRILGPLAYKYAKNVRYKLAVSNIQIG